MVYGAVERVDGEGRVGRDEQDAADGGEPADWRNAGEREDQRRGGHGTDDQHIQKSGRSEPYGNSFPEESQQRYGAGEREYAEQREYIPLRHLQNSAKKARDIKRVPSGKRDNPCRKRPPVRAEEEHDVSDESAENRGDDERGNGSRNQDIAKSQQRHEQALGDSAQQQQITAGAGNKVDSGNETECAECSVLQIV